MNREERLAFRASRKIKNRIKTVITPFPISNAIVGDKIRGSILKYMFPCNGTIIKGMVKLGNRPKKDVLLTFSLHSKDERFEIDNKTFVFKRDIEVISGECLDVVLLPDEEEVITEVWISFLWFPAKKAIVQESCYELEEGVPNEGV